MTTETEAVVTQVGYECQFLDIGCHATHFTAWLGDVSLYVPRATYAWLMEALAETIAAIPVPEFFANTGNFLSGVPSHVWFFANAAAIPQGIGIVMSAYVIRFLIRRIPVIG